MSGSPTKRARLATDRTAASGAALSQEGPFFGRDRKTKCADVVDCTFRQGGWEGSPGPFDAAHGTRVTVTLTGAGADDMEVETVGDTAVPRGNDAEAGARMDCDDVGDEGGAPWVTAQWAALNTDVAMVPCAVAVTPPAQTTTTMRKRSHKKKHRAGNPKQAHERKAAAAAKFDFRPDHSHDWHHNLPGPGRPGT